ncbi:MAG TPA: site-2 protease family protein, partial [Steroidobacter sp.]|nr:site-2 protease family protein [Steroidobacter sp.]
MTAAVAASMAPARRLETVPPLREELTLHEGPRTLEGAPTWTLHDPVVSRFYRLGWPEFEMLSRWHLARPEAIAASVSARTTLSISVEDVEALVRFLSSSQLLQVSSSAGTDALLQQANARRRHWASSLLHNYLFFRVPLLRPQGLLQALRPMAALLYTRGFLYTVLLAALVGLWLVGRQWDQFLASLPYVFTLEGMVLTGCALTLAKIVHEFGHAMTADRYGCRVPTMGVAFLVLWPVLYTDTTEAWKLPSRRQRLAIGAAGMAAELALAAFATLVWCVLPPGPLRSAFFLLATSTWVLTLAVNLNPFMRFDGYYLLSDALDVPNLQDRSFALARWWLRERLFGFGDAPPEPWPARRRRLLIAYAFTTWVYRFFLFLGIALLVYHMFFKLLGIVLFAVEMAWFIVMPITRELAAWYKRRDELQVNGRTVATLLGVATMLALLVIPWRGSVSSPAVLRAQQQSVLYAPSAAQVTQINVQPGARVRQGDVLFQFASMDLAHQQEQAEREVRVLNWQAEVQSMRRHAGDRALPVSEELERARAQWTSYEV